MSGRPRLLDLFCGAGGASVGYHRAGFDAMGVDIAAHPDYPYSLHVADAMEVLTHTGFLDEFDVIHASPPCQGYTTMSNRHPETQDEWPKLIAEIRDALAGRRYVIENVPGAKPDMRDPILLHGGMFGLGVHRPRLFETSEPLMLIAAEQTRDPLGVYGKLDGRRIWTRTDGSEIRAPRTLEQAQAAMGIDWMTDWDDVREAIPPAYTQFIGEQLLDQITRQDDVA